MYPHTHGEEQTCGNMYCSHNEIAAGSLGAVEIGQIIWRSVLAKKKTE